jgi:hypothetical protein
MKISPLKKDEISIHPNEMDVHPNEIGIHENEIGLKMDKKIVEATKPRFLIPSIIYPQKQ